MPQILALIEALASHVNAGNIEQAIELVEKLITLAESIKQAPVSAPVVNPVAQVLPTASGE